MTPKTATELEVELFSSRELFKILFKEASAFSAATSAIETTSNIVSKNKYKKFIIHPDSFFIQQSKRENWINF